MHTVIKQSSDRLRKPVDETFATPAGTTPDEWRGPHCVDRGVSAPSHIAHGTYCGARGRSSQHERAARSSSRPYRHRQLAAKRPLLHSNCLTSTFYLSTGCQSRNCVKVFTWLKRTRRERSAPFFFTSKLPRTAEKIKFGDLREVDRPPGGLGMY